MDLAQCPALLRCIHLSEEHSFGRNVVDLSSPGIARPLTQTATEKISVEQKVLSSTLPLRTFLQLCWWFHTVPHSPVVSPYTAIPIFLACLWFLLFDGKQCNKGFCLILYCFYFSFFKIAD